MGRRKSRRIESIQIIDFAHKGKTIGKDSEGFVYLIDGPVPGDVVNAIYYKKKKGLRLAKAIEYPSLSDKRTQPKCEHFGICGGCKWQHTKYEAQLFYKEKTVRDAIQRIALLDPSTVEEILPCEQIYYYRNKVEYTFCNSQWITQEQINSGEEIPPRNVAGFHVPGVFNKVVDINACHLQESLGDRIRIFIKDFANSRGYSFFDYGKQQRLLRNVTIRNTSIGQWMVSIIFRDSDEDAIQEIMAATKEEFPQITSLYYVINQKQNDTLFDQHYHLYAGEAKIMETLGSVKYKIGPKSFFQTNSLQAKKLYDLAVEFADLKGTELVYDLYTGLGSIALYIAAKAKFVVGIEEIEQAIEDAKENMILNQVENTSFYSGDVKDILNEDFIQKHGQADVVITDPPRAGMHADVVQTLLQLKAQKIIYISCNPSTQARDIKMLSEQYDLKRVKPVDMFPHTQHIESVALLTLK